MTKQNRGASPSGRGDALQATSNGLVHLMTSLYGRGPTKAKTYILDESYVICVMHEIFTTAELTLITAGEMDLVRQTRVAFQTAYADQFRQVVSDALDQRVLAYQSQIVFDPPVGLELFTLETP